MTARRSSFFCRQLNSVLENSTCDTENAIPRSEDDEIILKHVAEIERTIADWRAEYLRTRTKYRDLEKYKDNVNVIEYNQCKDLLLPEDLEFLNNRLDFTALNRDLEEFISKLEVTNFRIIKTKLKMGERVEELEHLTVDLKRRICKYLMECDESADLFAAKV